jgi:DNA-binding NarL/FixJ family response regulator
MNTSAIYIVVDDSDDEEIIREAFAEVGVSNELKFFSTGEGVLNELRTTKVPPFIIISDVNLPRMDGFQLREKILQEASINDKSIPFIFWSTSASEAQIKRAYDLSAHGFFLKGRTFAELKERIREMVAYWSDSLAPNSQKTH